MGKIIKNQGNKGFTTMLNDHFYDSRLSWGAKGMLSNVFSLPDNWEFSLKGFQAMASDGERVVRSCLFELEWFGYLQRIQIRNRKGKILDYDYEFFNESQFPDKKDKLPKWGERKAFQFVKTRIINEETGETIEERPFSQCERTGNNPERQNVDVDENPERQNVEMGFVELQNAETESVGQLNTNELNNKILLNNKSINHSGHNPQDGDNASKVKKIDRLIDSDLIKDIKDQIQYDYLAEKIDHSELDVAVSCIAELYTATEPQTFNGRTYDANFVHKRSLKIEYDHIEYVFECFNQQRKNVTNIRKYLATAIFNAPDTIGAYNEYAARVAEST